MAEGPWAWTTCRWYGGSDDMTDPSALATQLEELLRRDGQADVRVSDVRPIPGGYSLQTYSFLASSPSGSRRYVLRADPPVGEALTQTDRHSEWELLSGLTAKADVP